MRTIADKLLDEEESKGVKKGVEYPVFLALKKQYHLSA